MEIVEAMEKRYSAKEFDSKKKIPEDLLNQVESLLQLSASSLNIQPWYFTVAISSEAKEKIAKAANGNFIFNKDKILKASAVVVFSAKRNIDQKYLLHLLEKERSDGRFKLIEGSESKDKEIKDSSGVKEEPKEDIHILRMGTLSNLPKADFNNWVDKQIYLNVGSFLLGVVALGLDAVPIEGFVSSVVDEELGLGKKGLASILLVPIGYHTDNDFNAKLPKSRFLKEDIIERI